MYPLISCWLTVLIGDPRVINYDASPPLELLNLPAVYHTIKA